MELNFSILTAFLFFVGFFLLLERSLIRNLLGILLLSYGANFLLFVAAGIKKSYPPIIGASENVLASRASDPLPQALILTAIVIGFGVSAFFIVLCYKAYKIRLADDSDSLRELEK